MAKFQVEVEEILQRVEEVEANDLEEALDIIDEKYYKQEIVLDADDFKGYEVREYRDGVRIQDLEKDSIFDIKYGKAILLEGNKDLALIKIIGVKDYPYLIVTGLKVGGFYTYFEWENSLEYITLNEAISDYEKIKNENNLEDFKAQKLTRSNDFEYIEINIQNQIDKVKDEIKNCNTKDFDDLIDKYRVFNNIKNTIDEDLIEVEQFQKVLEEDHDILEKIYNKVQSLNLYSLPPTFDEVMLETFLKEFSDSTKLDEENEEIEIGG